MARRWAASIALVAAGILGSPARADEVTQLRVGGHASCALLRSGQVSCWGLLPVGGRLRTRAEPVAGLEHAVELSFTDGHACARLGDGSLRCWGWNNYGQVGDGTTLDRDAPVRVTALGHATAVFAGYRTTCALDGDRLRCWGERGERPDFVPPGLAAVRALGVPHALHTAALGRDGNVVVFGDDVQQAFGHPVERVAGIEGAVVALGRSCALTRDGRVWCWGLRNQGQRGDGVVDDSLATTAATFRATPVVGLGDAVALGDGGLFACAVRRGGQVVCWGANRDGQLGSGERSLTPSPRPVPVAGLEGIAAVAVGDAHACALSRRGQVLCWGGNLVGEVGDGTQAARARPTPVLGLPGSPAARPPTSPREQAQHVYRLVYEAAGLPAGLARNRFVEECLANELCQVTCKPALVSLLDPARFAADVAICLPLLMAQVSPALDDAERRRLDEAATMLANRLR